MNQQPTSPFSLKKSLPGFKYAFSGLKSILATQVNFLIHLAIAVLVTAAGIVFKITLTEWCIIILTIAMVLVAEAINTSVEKLTDLVSPEKSSQAGNIKDIAAASVLIAAIAAVIIGLTVFIPRII